MSETFRPFNPETHPSYNTEPGVVVVPGSNYAKEMEKHEQFPSKYGQNPGNAYKYRPFPKMLYKAHHWNGVVACMAAPPDSMAFSVQREYERAEELAKRFTEKCQLIVASEAEQSRAMESGWRGSPAEAIEYLNGRDSGVARATAERLYVDSKLSEPARREAEAAVAAVGGEHVPEIPEKPLVKRAYKRKPAA